MIGYLLKNWKLLLDLILVVGGIIALTLFDPFGLFSSTKLKSTANLVSSIRDIGELTTAEYYGEVISSLHETKIYNVPADSLYEVFEECYIELRRSVAYALRMEKRIKTNDWRKVDKSSLTDSIRTHYNSSNGKMIYGSLLTFIAVNNLSGEAKDHYFVGKNDPRVKPHTEREVLEFLTDQFSSFRKGLKKDPEFISEKDLNKYIMKLPTNFTGITNFHYELKKEITHGNRKRRKQDIVFIGRGWVKAGFRFEALDQSNFYYDEKAKVIQFFGLVPTILDKDINPWFIPEEKIKGFELVNYYKGATFNEAKKVKKKCKEKLLEQAHHADILKSAKENGEQTLKDFFSLLLDEPDLKVEMLDFPFGKEYEMIAADTLVTVNEAMLIERLYQKTINDTVNQSQGEIDRKINSFKVFLNRLKKLTFVTDRFQFSLLSLEAAKILDHALFVTPVDYEKTRKLHQPLMLNKDGVVETEYILGSKFYENYNEFTRDFNQMLQAIDHVLGESEFLREDTLFLSASQVVSLGVKLDTTYFEVLEAIYEEDTIQKILHKETKVPEFYNLRYPILDFDPRLFDDISLFNTEEIDGKIEDQKSKSKFTWGDSTMMDLIEKDLKNITKYKVDSVERSIKLKPVRSLGVSLNKLIKKNESP